MAGGWENGRVCSMGIEFPFCKMKSSRDLLHNNVHIVNTSELYMVKKVNFILWLISKTKNF